MSAPLITASQTNFCDAMLHVNISSEPNSGYDTPVPRARISDETINTLNFVKSRLEGFTAKNNNPRKRRRSGSPNTRDPKEPCVDSRDKYLKEFKPIYIRLKTLYRKRLFLASNIKSMEGQLAKNSFPASIDFMFNINSTRNAVLKDLWTRSIRKCKTDMRLVLRDDLQKTYNTKAQIAKDMMDLERLLNPEQLQEIKESLNEKFKQMAPSFMERKQYQYREGKSQPKRKNLVPRRRTGSEPVQNRFTTGTTTGPTPPPQKYLKRTKFLLIIFSLNSQNNVKC